MKKKCVVIKTNYHTTGRDMGYESGKSARYINNEADIIEALTSGGSVYVIRSLTKDEISEMKKNQKRKELERKRKQKAEQKVKELEEYNRLKKKFGE